MTQLLPLQPASLDIWDKKYRLTDKNGTPVDADVDATYRRVAKALSDLEEPSKREHWHQKFLHALRNGAVPAGRITSNAGGQMHKPSTSLINCLGGDTPVLTRQGVRPIRELTQAPVEVLNARGEWVEVQFQSYGFQETVGVAFRSAATRKASTTVIRATKNHRWILVGGQVVTTEYWTSSEGKGKGKGKREINHSVVPCVKAPRPERNADYEIGVFHGLLYGDGHVRTDTDYYVVDLVGEKQELSPWVEKQLGKKGLPTVYNKAGSEGLRWNFTDHDTKWKELPSTSSSPSYLLGFIAGLLATDGSITSISKGSSYASVFGLKETVDFVAAIAPAVGIMPYSASLFSTRGAITAYGERRNDLWRVALNVSSLDQEDVLRTAHKNKFSVNDYGVATAAKWKMDGIVPGSAKVEEVFCCQEETTGAFVLATGLLTGNCTVANHIKDSMDDIMTSVHQAALTLKSGAGIGYSFSTLRPRGAFVLGAGASTSGPLSFMDIYDKMCFTVASAGGRRGAQMGTFDVSHPDVREFVKAKREDGRLRQFNLSLLITDGFMEAVETNQLWPLVFPVHPKQRDEVDLNNTDQVLWREWPITEGYIVREDGLVACKIYEKVPARRLWDLIMTSTYDFAEPGFILIDRVNEMNNNWWCENIQATNPCVTGDTPITTDKGDVSIASVVGTTVRVWNGREFSEVIPMVTGENLPVVRMTFSNGKSLRCTPYHGFHLSDGRRVEAKALVVGDVLEAFKHPNGEEESGVSILALEAQEALEAKVYCFNEPLRHRGMFNGLVTGQCGEQPLPPSGSCLLGSINLTSFVRHPFTGQASFDWDSYTEIVGVFTRMLDNVVEINGLPLPQQRHEIEHKRRHGMGFLGLGSTLTMLRVPYGSAESLAFTERVTREMAIEGWRQGLALAQEKGPAPIMGEVFEVTAAMLRQRPEMVRDGLKVGDPIKGSVLHAKYSRYMQKVAEVEPELVKRLAEVGSRFTHHSSIAPTGTISLSLGNNASNGIEPSFAHHYSRNIIREGKKSKEKVEVYSYELLAYRALINPEAMPYSDDPAHALPAYFIAADQVTPKQHVDIQAASQKWIDSSISKTANVPTEYPFEDFKDIYTYAYHQGLKGCTTFRFNPATFQGVLVKESDLANTVYRFTLADGSVVEAKGNDTIDYDGEQHSAANLFDALKEGYYGKF